MHVYGDKLFFFHNEIEFVNARLVLVYCKLFMMDILNC